MPPVIVYHYSFSPYARRILWYLRLRGIPYLTCAQPPTLPRPDVRLLGLKHRRIPIVAIGGDVYLDTRLILRKLARLPPSPSPAMQHPPSGTQAAGIERLLSAWSTDGGLFSRAMQLLPGADLPLLKNKAFQRDRADFVGHSTNAAGAAALRPEAMAELRDAFALLESTFFADGRDWILGGQGPTTADIEAVWLFHWLSGLKGALDPATISPALFPSVFAWVDRFQRQLSTAKTEAGTVSGEEARDRILGQASQTKDEVEVDANEMLVKFYGLQQGSVVEVWPVDSGSAHVDVGRLLGLDSLEIVFETDAGVRVHAPRHGFRQRPVISSNL
ncbi:hypothetical protein QBC47DRAFT_222651 [Echria macrotheca]|uniref:GST N-terminal domain-containing protein n=1 Tax=Echria macrotheca TaxID=438768 RepID=A0AAJ0FAU9_9PEZI|nr:hypothetical protein QBC47DRAFT_222651 [Echria macrotheca]